MIPAPYGFPIAQVRSQVMRCVKPPPADWRSIEWLVMGGRQSGGIASIPGCGGELYHYGEYVGILANIEFQQVWDARDPVVLDGESYPRLAETKTLSLAYVPAVWYLVG